MNKNSIIEEKGVEVMDIKPKLDTKLQQSWTKNCKKKKIQGRKKLEQN